MMACFNSGAVFLLFAGLVASFDGIPDQTLTLSAVNGEGRGQKICPPGQPCIYQPVSGANITIVHGDKTCSNLFLYCDVDKISVVHQSPRHSSEVVLSLLGSPANPSLGGVYPPNGVDPCVRRQNNGDLNGGRGSADMGRDLWFSVRPDQCGPAIAVNPQNPQCEIRRNELEIIEFLDQGVSPPIHLISHTHVHLECCWCSNTEDGSCPPPEPKKVIVENCTVKSFSLDCVSDHAEERFQCQVALQSGQSLGTQDFGFYVEECTAKDSRNPSVSVNLFQTRPNSAGTNDALQVEREIVNKGNVDQTRYLLDVPWFQFSDSSRDCDVPHQVEICCTVKLASKAQLAQYQVGNRPSSKPSLANVNYNRLDAGFFKAGELTLLK